MAHPCTCSLAANAQRKQAGEVSPPYCQLMLLGWKKQTQRPGPPWNHISRRQFIRYQRENEYNKGPVRQDSNGEGKSHTRHNRRRSVPDLDSSREDPGSQLTLSLSEEQQGLNLFCPVDGKSLLVSCPLPASKSIDFWKIQSLICWVPVKTDSQMIQIQNKTME